MPTCRHCGTDHDVEALVRHQHESVLLVHCPDCHCLLGSYREPGRHSP